MREGGMTPGFALLFPSLMLSANSPVNAREQHPQAPALLLSVPEQSRGPAGRSAQAGSGLSCKSCRFGARRGGKGLVDKGTEGQG